jgi:hypothetical protein
MAKFQSVADDLARGSPETTRATRGEPEAPPTQSHFVSITGTSFSLEDYKKLFTDSTRFRYKKASTTKKASENEVENLKPAQKKLIRAAMSSVLDQVLIDDDLTRIIDAHEHPDVSYYYNMSERAVTASDRRRNDRKEEASDYKTATASEKLVGSKNFESMIHNILDKVALDALQDSTIGLEPRIANAQRGSGLLRSNSSMRRSNTKVSSRRSSVGKINRN